MPRSFTIITALLLSSVCLSAANAQKFAPQAQQAQQAAPRQVQAPQESAAILPGQKLADVEAILRKYGRSSGRAGFQIARRGEGAEEIKHIAVTLDPQKLSACIDYKAGTEIVTGIGVVHSPPSAGRAYHFWTSARQIVLHPDGSYLIQFEAPPAQP